MISLVQNILRLVIYVLYFFNLLHYFRPVLNNLSKESKQNEKLKYNKFESILGLISFLIVMIFVCFFAFKMVISLIVLVSLNIALSTQFLLEKGNDPLLKKVEIRQNPNFWVFMSIGIIILGHSDINKISDLISSRISNGLLSDFVYLIYLLGMIYLHSIMIVPLVLLPVNLIGKGLVRLVSISKRGLKKLDKIVVNVLNKSGTLYVSSFITSFLIKGIIRNDCFIKKVFAILVFLPSLLIDLLRNIIKIVLLVLFGLIKCILELLSYFIVAFASFIVKITDIKDRIIISYTVRVSTVLSLTFIVVLNRVFKLLNNFEDGTAVLEFLASTIIIPLLINWIYDAKKDKLISIDDGIK